MDFIEIVKSYLKNEKLNNEIYDKELVKIAIEQSLETILYPTLSNEAYLSFYVSWAMKQELFYSLDKEITDILNKNKIPHIYFKGTILSKIYDDPSIRTRGDIDLYVSPDNIEKTISLLKENGFIDYHEPLDSLHHIVLEKKGVMVEVHFYMLDSDDDKNWIALFKDPFKYAVSENEYRYKFIDTYHFIYCMMHFAHHLRCGAGIRYILDFYYMLKKTSIDFNLLHKLLDELKLNILYSNIINTIYELTSINYDNSIENKDIKFFIDYLLSYGIHGTSNNDTAATASVHKNKKKYLFHRIFLIDKNYRKALYPKLGKKAIFYPLCVIHHILWLITHKFKTFIKFLFGKNKNKELYKKLGI